MNELYVVLKNMNGQYSLSPAGHDIPGEWQVQGGPKAIEQCLDHLHAVWPDMQPVSKIPMLDTQRRVLSS